MQSLADKKDSEVKDDVLEIENNAVPSSSLDDWLSKEAQASSCRTIHGLSYSVRDLPFEICVVPSFEIREHNPRVCESVGGEFLGWTMRSDALCDMR